MKKETVIKNEWENYWFCEIKDLQSDPKVNGTKITFSVPVKTFKMNISPRVPVDVSSDTICLSISDTH